MSRTNAGLPPGPKSKLSISGLLAYRRGRLEFLQSLAQRYGDIVYLKLGSQEAYFVNSPDLVKEVLVTKSQSFMKGPSLQRAKMLLGEGLLTSEGDFYRRQRRLAQPAFHRSRIETYAACMTDYADRLRLRWREGETLNVADEMMHVTLQIVSKTIFDTNVELDSSEVGRAMDEMLHATETSSVGSLVREVLRRIPYLKRFDKTDEKFKRARAALDSIIYRLIDERRNTGTDRGDLLSLLLLAQDDDGGGGMTDSQVRDEAITLFLTGHETTAAALTWTLYLLSQNADVDSKLWKEIDDVLGGRLPSIDDIPRLKYAEMVLSESMRLYPPAWGIQRTALHSCQIGGYMIPKGAQVLMSQYVLHRDKRYYPEPLRFDPERWTTEAREGRPQFAYFPFGGGNRRCMGEAFAWMEALLLLSSFVQKWRFSLAPQQKVALLPAITLRTKYGMRMSISSRK
jgi:cytochrome P450